ncbi:MAG: HEAT repeat domain-containing protein, partial [Dehalococcoidia bacterium]
MTRSPSILVAGAIAAAALIVAAIALLSLRPGPSAGDRDTTDAAAETAAPAGTPQPDPLLFTRPANLTPAVWIEQWQQRMPVNVTVKRGTKAESFGASRQNYRTYTISLTLSNNTGYAIGTAGGLYLIETTLPSATGDLLTISGGSFRRKPPEDFGGAVEFRGVAESGPTAHGFYNSQTMGERGIVSRRTGPVISIMVSNSSDPDPASFGAAAAGERLTFTSELQLLVVVPQDKQDRVVVVTPELRVSGSSGERASFRYLLTFQPDGTPLDTRLLVMSEEELLPLLRDNQTALWQRVLASPWAAQFAPEAAAPELLRLMSARGQENEGLRAASMLGLAQIRADGALAPLTTVAGDPTEAIDARIAAVQALGILGSADATPSLLGVIEGADAELVSPALRSLGRIGDRSAVPALLALIENDARGDHHAAASEALQSVVGPPDVQRLSRLAANDRARGAKQAIKLLGGIGTAEAVGALTPLYRTGADDVRRSVCEALATSDTPEALSVLRSALDDRAKDVATAAAKALAGVSSPDRTAALREALRSANVDVQRAAVQAIGANQRM